jgi:trehalose synthase
MLTEVQTGSLRIERLTELLGGPAAERVRAASQRARVELGGRSVVNVNSTARGGGVAEMLLPLVAYARGLGIDARWLVADGDAEFFRITKRIHNRLHGVEGDGGPLGAAEEAAYEARLRTISRELLGRLGGDDIVILHDPQTAGLIPALADARVPVIWRCHVGVDNPNDLARSAWRFLYGYVNRADRVVFSREQFAWDDVEPSRRVIIAPSIDALGPKNQELPDGAPEAILRAAGLRAGRTGEAGAGFVRLDGRTANVRRRAELDEDRPLEADARYVLQVSRWDRLKDPLGVIDGFAAHIAPGTDAHLVYAGPDVRAVSDDPEGAEVLREAHDRRAALPADVRQRVHLALLPMDDLEENGAIVNALQREAAVVVQKSIAEGFGLTVAEAMWKARPVVASRVGGIRDQIEHGHTGLLLDDPADLREYGAAVRRLLGDAALAAALGRAARERVRERFLGTHSLLEYLAVIEAILQDREAAV